MTKKIDNLKHQTINTDKVQGGKTGMEPFYSDTKSDHIVDRDNTIVRGDGGGGASGGSGSSGPRPNNPKTKEGSIL